MHLVHGSIPIPQRTDIDGLSVFGRAERVIVRMGIKLTRSPMGKMPNGAGGVISQPYDKATREFKDREIRLVRKIRASSALGQWCLWHELGHAVDFLRDTDLECKFMCAVGVKRYGKLSQKYRKLLRHHSGFIAGLNETAAYVTDDHNHVFATIPAIKGAIVDRAEERMVIDKLKVRRVQVARYEKNLKELFAEAFACFAMYPELLWRHAKPVYDLMAALFAKLGLMRISVG